MKIRKIITKSNEELAILIKRGPELISITIDSMGNIDINGFDDDMLLLEEIANLQLQNQQIENFSIEDFINDEEVHKKHFTQDEEE